MKRKITNPQRGLHLSAAVILLVGLGSAILISLAFTVACITIFISFGFYFVANHLPADLKSDARGENESGRDRLKNI